MSWLKLLQLVRKCLEIDREMIFLILLTVVSILKIMMICPSGSLKMRRNITSRKHQLLNNSFNNRSKDLLLLMQEFLRKFWKLKLEEK